MEINQSKLQKAVGQLEILFWIYVNYSTQLWYTIIDRNAWLEQ